MDHKKLILALAKEQVEFIIVGGVAAVVHGSARATFDLDVVYARNSENLKRLVRALKPHSPYLRDAPAGLPFQFDVKTLKSGLNFTLSTKLGELDLFGEIVGGGTYEDLLAYSTELEVFGVKLFCVTLERLIAIKRAAGRPKDLEAVAELQAILDERKK